MKRYIILLFLTWALFTNGLRAQSFGELPPFTEWYQNPLGFSPLKLHTGAAFYLGGLAAAACLIFTENDTALADRFSFFNESGMSYGYNPPYTSVYQNNTGFFYHARKWLAIGAEVSVYHFRDSFNDTWGIGLRPLFRWYPVHGEDFRLYFECGAGIIGILDNFPKPSSGYGFLSDPRTGTHFNGSPKYGIGREANIDAEVSVVFGLRHVHISNGNTSGAERNPGHDSNGYYFGFSYRPNK